MVAQVIKLIGARVDAERHADVVHFLGAQELGRLNLPCIQYLAAQRHDGLRLPIPRLLRRAAGGIPLHQEQFRQGGLLTRTVREFAR